MQTQANIQKSAKIWRRSFYQKLFFLYLLNLSDWLCTRALLASGKFVEANPLMRPVITEFFPALLLKGVLPLIITLLCAVFCKLADIEESRVATVMLNAGIAAYTLVNLWHVINFILLFTA